MTEAPEDTQRVGARASDVPAYATPVYEASPPPANPWVHWGLVLLPFAIALVMLPIVIAIGAPWQSWALATGLWAFNRLLAWATVKIAIGLPQTMAVGVAGLGMMLRVWFVAFVFLFVSAQYESGSISVGFGSPEIGVPAILQFMVLFTIDIVVRGLTELNRFRSGRTETTTMGEDQRA